MCNFFFFALDIFISMYRSLQWRVTDFFFSKGTKSHPFSINICSSFCVHDFLLTSQQQSLETLQLIIDCQPNTVQVHLRIKSLLRDCLDKIGLWECLRDTLLLHAIFSQNVVQRYIRQLAEHEPTSKPARRVPSYFLLQAPH